jgi:hypothetical protein
MGTSTTALTLRLLRRRGLVCCVVEKWIPGRKVRLDAFHVGDILACDPRGRAVWLVQSTSRDHVSHRVEKARSQPELQSWLAAGGRFLVIGWAKKGRKYECREVEVTGEDLQPVELTMPRQRRRQRVGQRQGTLFVPQGAPVAVPATAAADESTMHGPDAACAIVDDS